MALRDLFYACPGCGGETALVPAGGKERCRRCGAEFRRTRGARIAARLPQGGEEVHSAAEWLQRLPFPVELPADRTMGPERAILRIAGAARPYHARGELIGWGERFGPKLRGHVRLTPDALIFRQAEGTEREWPLARLTAVQPTSSALQVKVRDQPVAYLKFLDGSVRLWEHRIQQRLRTLYQERGWGEIVEFQPRITTR